MSANASTAGLRVLRHILELPVQDAAHAIAQAQPFLTYDEDKKALAFIRSHLASHGQMPHPDTVLEQCAVFLPPVTEPLKYDLTQLRNRFLTEGMQEASDAASELILNNDAQGALKALLSRLLPLTHNHGGLQLFDFRDTGESALAFYKSQLDGTAPEMKGLGFHTLDAQGGIEDGDMIGIIGRPGSGKTWLMLSIALHMWDKYKEPVLFVTQEMSSAQIEKRLLPMACGVDPTPLYRGTAHQYELNGLTHAQYLAELEAMAEHLKTFEVPFLIYDSKMAGTVGDVENIAAIHAVKNVFIDGAYMLRHPNPSLGRYARVPENLDLMKGFTQRTGARLISSWQFKRNAGKQDAADETPDLDDIGYSHAIGEYMGVILGLLESPKSVSQLDKKKVTIMKGRNGETGSFDINWNFKKMDFTELTLEASQADLTYI